MKHYLYIWKGDPMGQSYRKYNWFIASHYQMGDIGIQIMNVKMCITWDGEFHIFDKANYVYVNISYYQRVDRLQT